MRVHGLMAGGVTLAHVAPPSVVTWMFPSSVPAHSTVARSGEGDSAVIAPCGPAVTPPAYRPALAGTGQFCRARSGLMRVHLWPRSPVFQTAFET